MKFRLMNSSAETKKNCIICNGDIEGSSYMAVNTSQNEYCAHPSCVVTGFAMCINGIAVLVSWLKQKNDDNDNLY